MRLSTYGAHFPAWIGATQLSGKHRFDSARAALATFLHHVRPDRLFLPHYVCEAVIDAAEAASVETQRFALNEQFECADNLDLQPNDWVLIVDYFGLCGPAIERQCHTFPQNRLIVDRSQAWFAPKADAAATLYSPRKFLPVGDGGVIVTDVPLAMLPASESLSLQRYEALVDRIDSEPELSREGYLAAEASIDCAARSMSHLTSALIDSFPAAHFASKRRSNFERFDDRLRERNAHQFLIGSQVPIAYPFAAGDPRLRARLIERRLFVPRYWPSLRKMGPFETRYADETVFLPIDHRYDHADIDNMADIVLECLGADNEHSWPQSNS